MGIEEVLKKLRSLDADSSAEVERYLEKLKNDSYNAIAEVQELKKFKNTAEKALTALIEGQEGEDVQIKAENVKKKLKEQGEKLAALDKENEELKTATAALKHESLLRDAAGKSGATYEVLKLLVKPGDESLSIVIGEDGAVKLGNPKDIKTLKGIKEYAEASADWKPFLPSLFPVATNANKPLPTGVSTNTQPVGQQNKNFPSGAGTSQAKDKNLARAYINKMYGKIQTSAISKTSASA